MAPAADALLLSSTFTLARPRWSGLLGCSRTQVRGDPLDVCIMRLGFHRGLQERLATLWPGKGLLVSARFSFLIPLLLNRGSAHINDTITRCHVFVQAFMCR